MRQRTFNWAFHYLLRRMLVAGKKCPNLAQSFCSPQLATAVRDCLSQNEDSGLLRGLLDPFF